MTLRRLRRRLPRAVRTAGLRLIGREPSADPPMIDLALDLPKVGSATVDDTAVRHVRIRGSTSYVARRLADGGLAQYEPDTVACFLAAAEAEAEAPVYDIGANIGVFSWLAAARTRAEVVAFEPTPDLAEQARIIARDNALPIRVEELALGATPGTARLYLSDRTDSSNSLRAGFRPSHRSVNVRVETLDGYVTIAGRPPHVLKIDTESTEPDVLRGGGRLLESRRPWILCEVLAGRTEADLMAILAPLAYTWYLIDGPGPLAPRSRIEGDASYVHMNWLFAPGEPDQRFWESMARWHAALEALPAPTAPASG